jgi:hypothetical protein
MSKSPTHTLLSLPCRNWISWNFLNPGWWNFMKFHEKFHELSWNIMKSFMKLFVKFHEISWTFWRNVFH